jgi:hypothetical protein
MSKEQVMTYVAAILTTLADLGTDCAESTVYMAMGMDLQKYEAIRGLLVASDLVTVRGNRIALTAKGRQTAERCNAVLTH